MNIRKGLWLVSAATAVFLAGSTIRLLCNQREQARKNTPVSEPRSFPKTDGTHHDHRSLQNHSIADNTTGQHSKTQPSLTKDQALLVSEKTSKAHHNDPIKPREFHVSELREWQRKGRKTATSVSSKYHRPMRQDSAEGTTELMAVHGDRVYSYTTLNRIAAISTAADRIRQTPPYNLDGEGQSVGIWDAGSVRSTHREFGDRVTLEDIASIHYHSTHVGGTIGAEGIDANAQGMAPAVLIRSFDWNGDVAEMAASAMVTGDEENRIQISNHSYGLQAGWEGNEWYGSWGTRDESDAFGLYDVYAAAWDTVCYASPYYLPFKSAGNDRSDNAPAAGSNFSYFENGQWKTKPYDPALDPPADGWDQGGHDTLPYIGNAKNVMIVGAVADAVAGDVRSISHATITSFSGWGPTDDGRIKPDIVANGSGLWSTYSSHDSSYASLSGTSMSSPNAAGSATLLLQLNDDLFGNRMRASTLKALILHTADDIGRKGPDFVFGWGLMNTQAAADQLLAHSRQPSAQRIIEGVITQSQPVKIYDFNGGPGNAISATLCWTDPPNTARNVLDDRTPVLVHDLDLRIIAPDGTTNFPYVLSVTNPTAPAVTGDNIRDNVEQVNIEIGTTGVWQMVVSAKQASLTEDQAYSVILSGADVAPTITHTPIANTTNNVSPHLVEAEIRSDRGLNTNLLHVIWDNGTGPVTGILEQTTGNVYAASIPAQPTGRVVDYYLAAETATGLRSILPSNAPIEQFSFHITTALPLTIKGSPVEIGTPDPFYGTISAASGSVVRLTAPEHSDSLGGFRYENSGWIGDGSAPTSGPSNALSFVLHEPSTVTWQWTPSFRLLQTSTPPHPINLTNWWPVASEASTVEAPEQITILFASRFTGWFIDGQRFPDATSIAENPASGFQMFAPRTAEAVYVRESIDDDNDGLPDWWELYYFGSTTTVYNLDTDDDGFTNIKEFQDGTNPRDDADFPSAPMIAHVPITGTVTTPAPWTITAAVIDNHAVASVTLRWSRNGNDWESRPMQWNTQQNLYTVEIAPPGITGDTFQYEIEAADEASLRAFSGPYVFAVRYPVTALTPNAFFVEIPSDQATMRELIVSNAGHAPLSWNIELLAGGFNDDVETGTNEWHHAGANDVWHISTQRSYSSSNAWFFGSEAAGHYPDSANAALVSPPILLSDEAQLTFRHWMQSETPKDQTYAWDGGFVEISTNDGASFEQITPEGGYPYIVFGHSESPYPEGTPCYAGNINWATATFDLSAYARQQVRIAFRFGSDGYVTGPGWFVDDILVTPQSAVHDWLTATETSGTTQTGTASQVALGLSSTNFAPAETRAAGLKISANDPTAPVHIVPVVLHSITRSITVVQPEFGHISPTGTLYLLRDDSTNLTITANSYHHITALLTNGNEIAMDEAGVTETNFAWKAIQHNGEFSAILAPDLATNNTPLWWLATHKLTNGLADDAAMADQDEDSMATWAEYIAGTDPTNASSYFNIGSVIPYGTNTRTIVFTNDLGENVTSEHMIVEGVLLEWESHTNRRYHLLGGSGADENTMLNSNILATPPTNVLIRTFEQENWQFYRLQVEHDQP